MLKREIFFAAMLKREMFFLFGNGGGMGNFMYENGEKYGFYPILHVGSVKKCTNL